MSNPLIPTPPHNNSHASALAAATALPPPSPFFFLSSHLQHFLAHSSLLHLQSWCRCLCFEGLVGDGLQRHGLVETEPPTRSPARPHTHTQPTAANRQRQHAPSCSRRPCRHPHHRRRPPQTQTPWQLQRRRRRLRRGLQSCTRRRSGGGGGRRLGGVGWIGLDVWCEYVCVGVEGRFI